MPPNTRLAREGTNPAVPSPQQPYLGTQCPDFAKSISFQARDHSYTLNSNLIFSLKFTSFLIFSMNPII